MKILPIRNNQSMFGAKLPKSQINSVVDSALANDNMAGIPKLYTLLERLDKMPGKNAELKNIKPVYTQKHLGYNRNGEFYQLRIDSKLIEEANTQYDVLYSAVTSMKTPNGKKISMPMAVFDNLWWKNRDKTAQDLEQFLRE